ncbi:SDR family NAD(P)-dependent oxidoreductase [Pararhodonellum marinum]|uniref:SDR family NAD(P)-dependent oxidoreductase n=1 Tax=Pararhodonellum marinum TaxID=2755358 RepID=UPI00188F4DE1|nr:SDR family NAD(P)-dependent oxidoreductase [Pararhodonellum marinum]
MKWQDKRIWIVGASSGIGAGLVKALATKEAKLVLSSRRANLMQELADEFPHVDIKLLAADMEDIEVLPEIAGKAWDFFGGLDYVFFNAGLSLRDPVTLAQIEAEKKIMQVNFWAPVILTKALLPLLLTLPESHLVLTSSLSGKFGVPKLSAYAASKHALHGYFESLRTETHQTGLKIHFAIPGFINTDITFSGIKGDGSPYAKRQESLAQGMDPDICAQKILRQLEKGKEEFAIGGMEKHMVWFHRLFPSLSKKLMRSNPVRQFRELKKKLNPFG